VTLPELRRLKALEEETVRLKQIVSQQVLDVEYLTNKAGLPKVELPVYATVSDDITI